LLLVSKLRLQLLLEEIPFVVVVVVAVEFKLSLVLSCTPTQYYEFAETFIAATKGSCMSISIKNRFV